MTITLLLVQIIINLIFIFKGDIEDSGKIVLVMLTLNLISTIIKLL